MSKNDSYPSYAQILESTPKHLTQAVSYLNQGSIVAIPTETVYGLAADATCDHAIARIYEFKNRPTFNPLIIHFADINSIKNHVYWNDKIDHLAQTFWPGPLTLIVNKKSTSNLSLLATSGLDTVGVRIPDHSIAQQLIQGFGKPLAAPSANPSQSISPTTAESVAQGFGPLRPLCILDGGPCAEGLESTILDVSQPDSPFILRPGLITQEQIETCLGQALTPINFSVTIKGAYKAPGQMRRHYAPRLPLRLNATSIQEGEALLAFGQKYSFESPCVLNLSEKGDLKEAAAHLFSMMRQLDQPHFSGIAVMPIPLKGIGMAINDRLNRASVT